MLWTMKNALGALDGWAKVGEPRQAKPQIISMPTVITVENEQDLIKIFAMPLGQQSNDARIAATQIVVVEESVKPG